MSTPAAAAAAAALETLSESEAVALHRALHTVGATHTPALRGGAIPSAAIERKSKSLLRFARLPAPWKLELVEQNPNKSSKWSRLAGQAHAVTWFIRASQPWALVVDDDVLKHGRCIVPSSTKKRRAGDDEGDDDDDDDRGPELDDGDDADMAVGSVAVASTKRARVDGDGDDSDTEELDDADVRALSASSLPAASLTASTPPQHKTASVGAASSSPPIAAAAAAVPVAAAAAPAKPLCKYGASCYRKNMAHLQAFSHPHLEALVEAQQKKKHDGGGGDDDANASTLPFVGNGAGGVEAGAEHDAKRARVDADGFAVPAALSARPGAAAAAASSSSTSARPLISLPRSVNEIDWAHIKLGAVIGKGAMGAVHRAHLTTPGGQVIEVAVKQLHQSADGELPQKEIDRFRAELILLSRLDHENVVKCYGGILSSSAASPLAIVMEFVAETLKRRITKSGGLVGTMAFAEFVEIALGMARGIAFLHDKAIIHRDLKPGNVLLRGNVAKLCDFGISRSHEGTSAMTRIGTPSFMAPEVLKSEPYGKSVDVYSFGMIAWQMSTAAHPFGKPGAADADGDAADAFLVIMKAAVKHERPDFAPNTPQPLVELIDACWHRIPAARPSAAEMVLALEAMEKTD
jgi:hypothetical protein